MSSAFLFPCGYNYNSRWIFSTLTFTIWMFSLGGKSQYCQISDDLSYTIIKKIPLLPAWWEACRCYFLPDIKANIKNCKHDKKKQKRLEHLESLDKIKHACHRQSINWSIKNPVFILLFVLVTTTSSVLLLVDRVSPVACFFHCFHYKSCCFEAPMWNIRGQIVHEGTNMERSTSCSSIQRSSEQITWRFTACKFKLTLMCRSECHEKVFPCVGVLSCVSLRKWDFTDCVSVNVWESWRETDRGSQYIYPPWYSEAILVGAS